MAVPNTGQLRLYGDIQVEIGGAQANTSLRTMSADAGFSTPDAMSDFYGYSSVELPTVSTLNTSGVYPTCLNLRGCVNNLGGAPSVARGFRFGPYSNINSNPSITNSNSAGTGLYCQSRNTSAGSTYYHQAWANNAAGQGVGGTCSTSTPNPFTVSLRYMGGYIRNSAFNIGTESPYPGNVAQSAYNYYSHPYLGTQMISSCTRNCTQAAPYSNGCLQVLCTANNTTTAACMRTTFGWPQPKTQPQGANQQFQHFGTGYSNSFPWTNRSGGSLGGTFRSSSPSLGCYFFSIYGNQSHYCNYQIQTAPAQSDIRLKTNINYL